MPVSVADIVAMSYENPSVFATLTGLQVQEMIDEVVLKYRNRSQHALFRVMVKNLVAHYLYWELYAQGLLTAKQKAALVKSVSVGPVSKTYGDTVGKQAASGKKDFSSTTWGERAADALERMPPAMTTTGGMPGDGW